MRASHPQFDKMQEETVQPRDAGNSELPVEQQLAEALTRLEQQREAMLRIAADAENARKRAQAEAATAQKYALERFADSLLPALDSLEAATSTRDMSGVELTLRQLLGALEKSGVREVAPVPGERFDPHRHQAMAAVEADADPNTVVALLQKGYLLHDRVLRPALVTVAKPRVENAGGNPISDTDLDQTEG
jgi:molecular chaperone GrpE